MTVFAQSASFTSDWNMTNETAGWPGTPTVYDGYPIIYDSGIHPGDVITRSSEPSLLQVARNTVWTDGQLVKWNPTNGFVLSWIPAARIVERGNASKLLDGFESSINSSVYLLQSRPIGTKSHALPLNLEPNVCCSPENRYLNWYHPHGGGGYEDVGAVEAVNCMLLLSIEGFIHFFPAWPVGETASFQNLRASGAFIVNASIDATGLVSDVRMLAEAGGKCVFLSPWGSEGGSAADVVAVPKVTCNGAAVPVAAAKGAGQYQFETKPGDMCTIAKA